MAKKIIEMVRAKRDKIAGDHAAAEELGKLAAAAVNDGVRSRAWERFMLEFVEKDPRNHSKPLDPAQLARLLGEDGSLNDEVLSRKRAYLLSNAMCGAGSPDTAALPLYINSIDDGLGGCEPEKDSHEYERRHLVRKRRSKRRVKASLSEAAQT